jgi:hypothetical protein
VSIAKTTIQYRRIHPFQDFIGDFKLHRNGPFVSVNNTDCPWQEKEKELTYEHTTSVDYYSGLHIEAWVMNVRRRIVHVGVTTMTRNTFVSRMADWTQRDGLSRLTIPLVRRRR